MSLIISRTRGLVAILAAAVLIIVPVKLSAATADPSTDTSLSVFKVNESDVTDNQTVTLPSNTASVVVEAQTSNPDATRSISGNTGLTEGNNTLIVSVTAADGTTTENHQVNLYVTPISSDTSLSVFKVNGETVADGQDVYLDPLTTSVSVEVVTTDPDSSVVVAGSNGLVTGDNSLTVKVVAVDGTEEIYTVNLNVAPNVDTAVSKLQVNGQSVVDSDSIELAPYTTEVEVIVETADPDAAYLVSGDTDLVPGENTLIVTVVAADGVTAEDYTITLNVLLGDDTSVSTLQVNGDDVSDGDTVELDPYTTEVQVDVETTDPEASYEVGGDTDLTYGDNTLIVTVMAADGVTFEDYVITLSVPLGNKTELSVLQVEQTDVYDGDSIDLEEGTTEVAVTVVTVDPDASVEVEGDTDLVSGENTLTVTVTAADGETTAEYTITLVVAPSTDTSLATLQVNGVDLIDGESLDLAPYTTEVDVNVVTTNPDATFEIDGGSELVPGENALTVTVTAADGVTAQIFTITLVVALGNNTNLTSLQVNGEDVTDGSTVDLAPYTTEVEVSAEAEDPDATYEVTGSAELQPGENILVVTVTAADDYASQDYVIILNVAFGNNVELATFQVNGNDVADGDLLELEPYTTEVDVTVETVDPDSTFVINGASNLLAGENILTVAVVAADGTSAEYSVILVVALGNNVALATFQVNGEDVVDGDVVELYPYTTDVDIVVETVDEDATYEITGGSELQTGENTLTVTVTAADGETTQDYNVTLNVALGDSTDLSSFTVNGDEVSDGDTVELAPLTTEVEVAVVTTDANATFEIEGDSDLLVGDNDLVVTVTAQNGEDVQEYVVNLQVAANTDTSAEITVADQTVADGDVITLDYGTDSVNVDVVTTDADASYEVEGDVGLVSGENTLTITITAADGETTEVITVTLLVLANTDTSLATFQVNGNDVSDGDLVELEPGDSDVNVTVETTDPDATYEIFGLDELAVGYNDITVTVTAADGETIEDHTVTVSIPLNNDTSLATFTVDGVSVDDGDSVDLAPFTTDVEVIAEASDSDATVDITGGSELVVGENTLTVTVTAADGETTQDYTVILKVMLNDDTSLSLFQINGFDLSDGDSIDLDPYTTEVEVMVETNDPEATFEMEGGSDLVPGENTLTVTVTAADGVTTQTYTVILVVALGDDTSLASFQVNGAEVADGDIVDLDPYTTEVEVTVETTDPDATVEISGGTDLVPGENELSVLVTAADGETNQEYIVILNVALGTNVDLAMFQVNGNDVSDGDSVDLEPYTTDVDVTIETVDPDATYEITGDSGLVTGENTLTVTVTAADGETTQDYTVTLNVLYSTDTSLSVFQVNGIDVVDGDVFGLDPYTTEADVAVETTDENATFEITGGSDLQTGENTLTVTVTAADGETTQDYNVTLVVALGNDTSLANFEVNGSVVEDGDQITLSPNATSVEVVAETTDPEATVEISGDSDLVVGLNDLVVTVTAQNGEDVQEYVVTLEVPLSDDTSISAVTINGEAVTSEEAFAVPAGTTDVDVAVETTDPEASVEISGDHGLVTGDNEITVTVTAADGETATDYMFIVTVLPSDDITLATFQVDGNDVADGDVIELDYNTTEVGVVVETTDPEATYEISGDSELTVGENTLTITVTAADGETVYEYTVTLVVPDGSITDLAALTVNGSDVVDGDTVDLAPGTTDVDVEVVTEDPNASFDITGDSGLVTGENTLVVTVTSADGSSSTDYTITLVVTLGIDTSLSTFQVNGNDVADGDVVDVEPGSTEVEVSVETTDPNATFEIEGDTGLASGENTLTVTVTAEDGETVQVYTVTLNVAANNNAELAVFTINDQDVLGAEAFDLAAGATSVSVYVETVDPNATFEVSGDSGFEIGENTLTVTVTAEDGETTQEYVITLNLPSNDTAVTSFSVAGLESVPGDIISVDAGTESVDVEVTARDENATVSVAGADALVAGDNYIVVTVTAQDGSTQDYTFVVRVGGQSADVALTSLTVNGNDVADGDTIQLPSRTTSVNVVATTRDAGATVKITGRTGLVVGSNRVNVLVTAADGVTTKSVTFFAVVAPLSSNTSLSEFTVNGTAVSDKDSINLPPLTRSVTVVAKPADAEAVAVITGRAVVDGPNTVTVVVTAADGSTKTYTVTVNVRPISTDKSLKSILFNGSAPTGTSFTTAPVATSVEVVATATDSYATVVISGANGLRVGVNTVSVLVTAENGSSATYKYTVNVPASNDTSLKSLSINGVDAAPGSTVTLAKGTKSVGVKATPTNAEAKAVVSGASNLVALDNTLSVTVTAADGVTTATYTVTLYVTPPSSDKSLKTFKINGTSVVDGGSVNVPALTTSVSVEAVANDPSANLVVSGRTSLVAGVNTVSVAVTAEDGTTKTYAVTVNVLVLSSDTSLKYWIVNGAFTPLSQYVGFGVKSVSVEAVANDPGASVAVIGNTGLRTGTNIVTIRVTAADGKTADQTVSVFVAKSSNTALSTYTVNGIDVLSGATATLPARSTIAVVKAVAADPAASVVITGTALVEGNNTVSATITADDGTVRIATANVYVTPLSSNTALTTFKVGNANVNDLGTVNVPNRTVSVPVVAVAADPDAVVTVSGANALRTGSNNTVVVTVIAANGTKKVYTVTVVVAKSSNTTLSSLTVNGLDASGGSVTLPARSTLAVVKAVAADPETKVEVSGTSLVEGNNTVVVTVTAPDATVRTVNVGVYVTPLSSNTSLSTFTVNGQAVVDKASVNVPNKTASVAVVATAADADAVVSVAGATGLKTGSNNTVVVTVIAANGTKKVYSVTVVVAKSSNTTLSSLTVNGNAVSNGDTVTLPVRTVSAVIKAVTVDAEAKAVITGGSSLSSGENPASVTVTAADGTTATTSFILYVTPLSSDNTLKSLQVNGSAYVADSTVELALGTKFVSVVAVANDAGAKVEISGNTNLSGGVNTITIKVTAANGDFKNYTAKVNVPVRSSNADISTVAGTWLINGIDVADEATVIELPAGTNAVTASAKTADAKASMLITGTTGLVTGSSNTVTFKVTAEDGTFKTYTRSVTVKALSSNTNLTSLTVAGSSVVDGATVNVPAGTSRVAVLPVLESEEARFTISGNADLKQGDNFLTVVVTAPSGASNTTTIKVVVAAPPSDTTLSTFTVNGTDVIDGSVVNVAAGTTRVRVSAIATDPKASVTIAGKSELKAGANSLVVTVTALSGDSTTYTVTVNVGN